MRKLKIPLLGHDTEVTEVDIVEKKDSVAEYTLEDGSVVRFAAVPTSVYRVDGQYTGDGLPLYLIVHGTIVTTITAPDQLRRGR